MEAERGGRLGGDREAVKGGGERRPLVVRLDPAARVRLLINVNSCEFMLRVRIGPAARLRLPRGACARG